MCATNLSSSLIVLRRSFLSQAEGTGVPSHKDTVVSLEMFTVFETDMHANDFM